MATFKIGKGDTAPSLKAQLKDADGPFDLADCSVEFVMATSLTAVEKVRAVATIVNPDAPEGDPDRGRVQYDWVLADTDTAGTYLGEFEVTLPSNAIITFPNDANKKFKVIVGLTLGD